MIRQWMMAAVAGLPLALLAAEPVPTAPAAPAAPAATPAPVAPGASNGAAPKVRKPHSKLRALQKECKDMADQKKLADEERKKYIDTCMRTH